ncbi:MAG: CocE/NonD family hydrolase [Pseudomonadota bacterium]
MALVPGLAVEQAAPLDHRMNERVLRVPSAGITLETTLFRPNGPGPFPLLVINHGKNAGPASGQPRERFIVMAAAFVKRGYAVMVPMRQGFAGSGGQYHDMGCDMSANGYLQADDIAAVVEFAQQQSWVDGEHIIVAGQSYGGLATLALGTMGLPGVRGLLNFAGGLRDREERCDWRAGLLKAFHEYGALGTLPSLWIYGENDSLFPPALVRRLHHNYEQAGGQARLVMTPPFKHDAHGLLASRDGEKIWWHETERFLEQVGMPTREVVAVSPPPAPARTDFASLVDIEAVPYLGEKGREGYREYLSKLTPRAFAVSSNGAWSWAEEGEDPDSRALDACRQSSGQACQLYSVDNDVVWPVGASGARRVESSP